MHHALSGLGIPNYLVDAGIGVPGESPAPGLETQAPDMTASPDAALIMHVNAPQMALAALRLGRERLRGRLIVAHWVWELETLPETWRMGLRFVHEIWVPSKFTAAAVAKLIPPDRPISVRVVPYPVAAAPPMPASLDRSAFGLPDNAVIVLVSLSVASSMARKNPFAAIAAFRAAFGDRTDRLLLLKLGNAAHYPNDLAELAAVAGSAPNIRIETRTFPSVENHALTRCCDIVMSLHRSEGFGLVPAEAMLLGKPVVATGWSGNMDFMDTASAALVGYTLVPVVDPRGGYQVRNAVWAEPDIAEAAGHLSRLAESEALRGELGDRARAAAFAHLGSQPLQDALARIGLHAPKRPKVETVSASRT